MKNVLSALLFLLCSFAAFGQFDPPTIINYKNGDTVFSKIELDFRVSTGRIKTTFYTEISTSNKFNLSDDKLIVHEKRIGVSLDDLDLGTTYFVRSRIFTDQGASMWSSAFKITVSDSIRIQYHRLYFDAGSRFNVYWDEGYASLYRMEYDTVATFNSPSLLVDTTSAPSYSFIPPNPFGKIFYRIKPIKGNKEGKWSAPRFVNGFVRPDVYLSKGSYNFATSSMLFGSHGINAKCRWQLSTDSLFSSITLNTLSNRYVAVNNLDFDTDLYVRAAYEHNGIRGKWSHASKFRLVGPELYFIQDGEKLTRPIVLDFGFSAYKDTLEVEIAKDSLFQSPQLMYKGVYKAQVSLGSSIPDDKLFVRWRVHHKNDTSIWNSISVFQDNFEKPISFNGIHEELFDDELFVPKGNLSFASYGTDFKKVW